ncbi:MAG TPA: hypothetical protein VLG27_04230 [Candidatus Saccharimonadia bacterium]|nr:hypothetical protein [Candidatus Saccharimonadia bacterium]
MMLAAPVPAHAYNLFGGVDCSKAANSTVCHDKGKNTNPLSGGNSLLLKITNIIAYIAGAAAVIVILVGAIRFITAGSDTSKGGRVDADVENARRSIASALIGLVIIVLAKLIITYLVNRV